jgi:hypothetical protein
MVDRIFLIGRYRLYKQMKNHSIGGLEKGQWLPLGWDKKDQYSNMTRTWSN